MCSLPRAKLLDYMATSFSATGESGDAHETMFPECSMPRKLKAHLEDLVSRQVSQEDVSTPQGGHS